MLLTNSNIKKEIITPNIFPAKSNSSNDLWGMNKWVNSKKKANKKIAVEHNGVIVPKVFFKKKYLKNNDRVEIVHFIGGG